ncbi:MAG: I78 family peptidase inhibitor [Pseudomonadota bacterium]
MKTQIIVVAIATFALSACTQTTSNGGSPAPVSTGPAPVTPSPGRTCDVSLVDSIGEPITTVRVPNNANYRVIRPNDVLTTDFVETRTNVDLDTDDTIKSVYCG